MKVAVTLLLTFYWANSYADTPKSEQSKAEQIVVEFYQHVFEQRGDVKAIAEKHLHPEYIQHNPYVATGREAFVKAIGMWIKSWPETQVMKIKRVITDGDFVVLHVHSYDTAKDEKGKAGVDIFRVEDGKIIEHWDVWQKIPESMPHENGMI